MIGRFSARERPEGQNQILAWVLGTIKNDTGDFEIKNLENDFFNHPQADATRLKMLRETLKQPLDEP